MNPKNTYRTKDRICSIVFLTISLAFSALLLDYSILIPSILMLLYVIWLYKIKFRNLFIYMPILIYILLLTITNSGAIIDSLRYISMGHWRLIFITMLIFISFSFSCTLLLFLITMKKHHQQITIIFIALYIVLVLLHVIINRYSFVLALGREIIYHIALLSFFNFAIKTKYTKQSIITDNLYSLKQQLLAGKITEEEYNASKEKILDKMKL